MTRTVSPTLRPSAASLVGLALLLAAALLGSAPFAATLAARAALAGRGDGLASIFLCFASGAPASDAQTGRPGPASERSIDCVLCQTLCCGTGPLAAGSGLVGAAPILANSLGRMVADRAAPTTRPRLSNRPRAPPAADPA